MRVGLSEKLFLNRSNDRNAEKRPIGAFFVSALETEIRLCILFRAL